MRKIFRALFYSKGRFQAVYLYAFIFIVLAASAFLMRLTGYVHVDNELILGVLTYVLAWIGIYNWQKKNDKGEGE